MDEHPKSTQPRTVPVQSNTFNSSVNAEIRRAAETGIYDIVAEARSVRCRI